MASEAPAEGSGGGCVFAPLPGPSLAPAGQVELRLDEGVTLYGAVTEVAWAGIWWVRLEEDGGRVTYYRARDVDAIEQLADLEEVAADGS